MSVNWQWNHTRDCFDTEAPWGDADHRAKHPGVGVIFVESLQSFKKSTAVRSFKTGFTV